MDGSVGLEEVGLEVDLESVSCDALDGVVQRQHVDLLAVLDIGAGRDGHHVAQADAKVVPQHSVHQWGGIPPEAKFLTPLPRPKISDLSTFG